MIVEQIEVFNRFLAEEVRLSKPESTDGHGWTA